jgi:hypothetical protein
MIKPNQFKKAHQMGFVLPQNAVALPSSKPDDSVIVLRGVAVPIASDVGAAFVSDCSRNKERLLSDTRIMEKWELTTAGWTEIAKNSAFRLAVDLEHERRVYNGDAARESAALLFSKAPHTIAEILNDKSASPKHRIDAARELRATANHGAEKTGDDADRVHIVINLGADKVVIDKQVAPLTPEEAKESFDAE